jgi:diguanylate cyclase (GGDEF)-like protein/putative nucleotidyltransferase with HDIG domain
VEFALEEEKAGRRSAARAAFEQALQHVVTKEDGFESTNVCRWIARHYHFEGDADAALDCLELAVAMAEGWKNDAAVGHALNVKAVVHWQRGDLDEAERLYLLARKRAIHAGDAKLAAMTAQNLGVLANIRGDFATAEQQYRASLADYRTLGLTSDVCIALNNLGLLYIAQNRWADAQDVLMEGTQICELTGDAVARTQLDINLAELWVKQREFIRAQGAVRKALAAAGQTGDASAISKATKLLGIIARETGRFEEADAHFQKADEVATARGELLLQAEIARDRADLARRTGRNRDVLFQLNRSHKLFGQLRAQHDLTEIGERVASLEQEFLHVARRWGESIEAKDRYTQGHCQRVAELACAIAKQGNFDAKQLFWFRIGALLHDVGKLVIPPDVLNKPGKLDDNEWALMKSHTTAGVEMLSDIEFPWDVRPMVESHHERWDGKGYPHGLAGNDIPLIARILTIADVYDALTSVRSYKRAMNHEEAMTILRKDVGTMFDPETFAWFEAIEKDWPVRLAHLTDATTGDAADSEPSTPTPTVDADASARTNDVAELDDLTKLPLRRAFRETVDSVLDARRTTGRPVSMLVVDVDHFKVVNDTYGHLRGDEVLRAVADRIRVNTRPADYIARYAGDEFVVLLPGTRLEDAVTIAERIRESVERLDAAAGGNEPHPMTVTLSIGVACAPLHGDTLEALFGAADTALYGAKRAGRNAVTSASKAGTGVPDIMPQCFVGRIAERERLRVLLGNAATGDPHVVMLAGEAGIGKSTMLKQLSPDIGIRGGAVLVGQCIEANAGTPYGPWIDIVRAAHRAGLVPPGNWRHLPRLVPELGQGDDTTDGGSQRAVLEEIEDFIRVASASRPVVLTIDDMQWADAATWDMLEFLLARFSEQRVLVCATIRPEDAAESSLTRWRRLSRSERYSEIQLERLTRPELAQWLRGTLGGHSVDETLLNYVAEQSEGNALFAVQTLRALKDDNRLTASTAGWEYVEGPKLPLPRAIGDLLKRRVEAFTREQREVLALAAAIGREFDPGVLVAAYDGPEAAVHDALDEALANGVLVTRTRVRPTLSFTHVLLTQALLAGVNPLRLQRLHEKAARVMETLPSRDPAILVQHYQAAGLTGDTYRTALEAGEHAQSVHAPENAAEFYRIAESHAHSVEERTLVAWRLAQIEESRERFSAAAEWCERVLVLGHDHDACQSVVAAARRMQLRVQLQRGVRTELVLAECQTLLAATDVQRNAEDGAALLVMLSTLQQRLGNIDAAQQLAREAVDVAERAAVPSLLADAVIRLGSALFDGNPANAIPHYRRALDMFVSLGDRLGQMRCHINIGSASDRAGNLPAAEVSYATALEIGRAIRASDLTGVTLLNLGVLLLKTGKMSAARSHFEDARRLFSLLGHEPHRVASLYNLAHMARIEGDSARALELYSACAATAAEMSHTEMQIGALAGVGLAELDLQSPHGARVQLDAASALIGTREDWWFQGRELVEALAVRLAASDGLMEQAEQHLLQVFPLAEAYDTYVALTLGGECASLLARHPDLVAIRQRLAMQANALGYQPIVRQLQCPAVVSGTSSQVRPIRNVA